MPLAKGSLFAIAALLLLSLSQPVNCWGQNQGSFQGMVLTSDHVAASNFRIKAYSHTSGDPVTSAAKATAKTDETGKFTLANLPKGTYTIAVFPPEPTESTQPIKRIDNVELPAGPAVRPVNFTIGRMGYFRVRLVKSQSDLTGEVYVDGNPYGRDTLRKALLTTIGVHKLTAASDFCNKAEEKVHDIRPYGQESAQEITLKCLE
jgi:hypothetical protein